jgi:clan AA aspartic protease (TIGR02281 family)
MQRLFTVRWPFLARLDAILLYPVALVLAAEIAAIHKFIDQTVGPALPSVVFRLPLPKEAFFWAELAIVGVIPYVLLLALADRLLTIRKGYAMLAAIAISAFATAALQFSPVLASLMPSRAGGTFSFLSSGSNAAFGACGLAFLMHLRPLWAGLTDQGEIAMRLIDWSNGSGYRRDRDTRSRLERDVYYRDTADLRGWHPQRQLDGAGGVPREGAGLKFLFGFAWVGIMAGLVFAWFHWNSWGSGGYEASLPGLGVGVQTTQPPAKQTMHPAALPSVSELPAPLPTHPQASPRQSVAAAVMPMVQRPTDVPASAEPDSGPNEAIAMRGKDGGFAFDAVINGSHLSMLFDTGASVVALRAEEAERFGINMSTLNYSAKVKTANGTTDVAPIVIDKITIGNITQHRVVGYVAKEGMLPRNLLGQTFLAGLAGYNVEDNRLVLKGR